MPHNQAGTVYIGHHSPNVQDPSSQCTHLSLQSERVVSRRYQIQRRPGHATRPAIGWMLPLHFKVKGESATYKILKGGGVQLQRLLPLSSNDSIQ